jgi:hypothetical protein
MIESNAARTDAVALANSISMRRRSLIYSKTEKGR